MADGPASRKDRTAAIAFGAALAGAAASWNPLAAPFGFVVGGGAVLLAARCLSRRVGSRKLAKAALTLGIMDLLVSIAVLFFAARIFGARPASERLVTPRSPAEMNELLDRAARDSSGPRERASRELDELGKTRSTNSDKRSPVKERE